MSTPSKASRTFRPPPVHSRRREMRLPPNVRGTRAALQDPGLDGPSHGSVAPLRLPPALRSCSPFSERTNGHEDAVAARGDATVRQASELRDQAFAACDREEWAICQINLDPAKRLEPQGEESAHVVRAPQAVHEALCPYASMRQ